MEQDDPAEALTELRERRPGAWELLQVAAGSGLAAYAVWALLLQPGFRRVPLRLQVRGGASSAWGRGFPGGAGQGWAPGEGPKLGAWLKEGRGQAWGWVPRGGAKAGSGLPEGRGLGGGPGPKCEPTGCSSRPARLCVGPASGGA